MPLLHPPEFEKACLNSYQFT